MPEGARSGWLGHELRVLDECDSSNAQLWHWAMSGAPHGAVLRAVEQTAGRGRQGRRWQSPRGSGLYVSMLLRPQTESANLAPFALVVGMSCARALAGEFGLEVGVKWPNDLYVEGRKLGGILLEARHAPGVALVVGVGINLWSPPDGWPDDIAARAISIWDCLGRRVEAEWILPPLLAALERDYERFEANGFAAFVDEYASVDVLQGSEIRYRVDERVETGVADGIDALGQLRVQRPDGGVDLLGAGEVHLLGDDES